MCKTSAAGYGVLRNREQLVRGSIADKVDDGLHRTGPGPHLTATKMNWQRTQPGRGGFDERAASEWLSGPKPTESDLTNMPDIGPAARTERLIGRLNHSPCSKGQTPNVCHGEPLKRKPGSIFCLR